MSSRLSAVFFFSYDFFSFLFLSLKYIFYLIFFDVVYKNDTGSFFSCDFFFRFLSFSSSCLFIRYSSWRPFPEPVAEALRRNRKGEKYGR